MVSETPGFIEAILVLKLLFLAPLDEPPHYKFNNVDDLKKFAQTWGQAHAYRLPVSKSKAGKNIYMDCSLSGEDPRPAGVERIRESKNRRCNCPFRVSGHKSSAEGHKNDPWELRGSKLPHNHGPIDIQYEVVHKGLPPDAQDEVGRLYSLGLQPAAIQRWLNTTQGRFVSLRTIYNTTAEQRRKKISNETPIQFLLRTVRDSNWDHDTAFDDKGQLLYLWFAHPRALEMARRFHHVVLMDCTYKTNASNYPLLHIVGQTATNMTFSIGFCFMRFETNAAYSWALKKLS